MGKRHQAPQALKHQHQAPQALKHQHLDPQAVKHCHQTRFGMIRHLDLR